MSSSVDAEVVDASPTGTASIHIDAGALELLA